MAPPFAGHRPSPQEVVDAHCRRATNRRRSSRCICRSRRSSWPVSTTANGRRARLSPVRWSWPQRFGESPQGTVRKAIDALAAQSLVIRRQGKGTFVSTHTEEKTSLFRFLRIRRNDGRDEYPASRLLDVRRGKASSEVARSLELKIGDAVIVLRRVLEYGGQPVVLDEIVLPAALFKGLTKAKLDAYRGSMYSFFETQFGVRMLKAQEKLRAGRRRCAKRRNSRRAAGRPAACGRPRDLDLRRPAGGVAARTLYHAASFLCQ